MSYKKDLKKAQFYIDEVFEIISEKGTVSNRNKVVAGYLSLTIQHFNSIILLIEKKLYSSAFTLLRPIFDTVYRGTWLGIVATDYKINKFMNGDLSFDNTPSLAQKIDKKIGDTVFFDVYKRNLELLNGLTHSGIEQIGKQFNKKGDKIEQSFKPLEVKALINSACSNLGMILLTFSISQDDKIMEVLAKKIIACK